MAGNPNRPLSPHLQVYRWGPAMFVSILHRATGDALAIAGALLFLWWLGAAASGPEAYQTFVNIVWHQAGSETLTVWNIIGRIVLIGLSWSMIQHSASGLRHLLLDTGAGYELKSNRMWSIVVAIVPALLTIALWMLIFAKGL